MSSWRLRLGKRGELLARRHLEAIGYTVLETNYRTRRGEVDLVAKKDGTLVFVEVRAWRDARFGSPQESLTPRKRSRIAAAAQEYIQAKSDEEVDWRIDLVALAMDAQGRLLRLEVIENAVEV